MAWDYEFGEGVPVDDDGVPRHPERGHPICAYPKTDATANNGRKRGGEGDACLLAAGWGTDRSTGACRNHFGASPGGPEGWANGNARHLLYSKRMNEDDRDVFEAVVGAEDGDDLLSVEDMADMLKTSIGWEYTRLVRAVDHIPDAEMVVMYECPTCGKSYRGEESGDCTGDIRVAPQVIEPCPYTGPYEEVPGKSWVEFGDKAVERKESHLANLIATYKQVADGVSINVDGTHEHTHKGGDAPVEVAINHVALDLPEDEANPEDDDVTDGES